MATFRIEVTARELRCFYPWDTDVNDSLKELDAQWDPGGKTSAGCWVLPIEAEDDVMAIAERAGYEVEVV